MKHNTSVVYSKEIETLLVARARAINSVRKIKILEQRLQQLVTEFFRDSSLPQYLRSNLFNPRAKLIPGIDVYFWQRAIEHALGVSRNSAALKRCQDLFSDLAEKYSDEFPAFTRAEFAKMIIEIEKKRKAASNKKRMAAR